MKLCDKLIKLRREKGYSQEQFADLLGISRQSVSKWESGQSIPELGKLITIADIFGVTIDYLVRDDSDINQENKTEEASVNTVPVIYPAQFYHYEYKSRTSICGIPLVHINQGYGFRVAKGIIAIGNISVGVISIGGISLGGFSIGGVGLGLLSLGGCAVGGIALGGFALGILAAGGLAIGAYAAGGFAIAGKVAVGSLANGRTAVGEKPNGDFTLRVTGTMVKSQIQEFILSHNPHIWKPLLNLMTFLLP